jgi:site-specific recombinase XerD
MATGEDSERGLVIPGGGGDALAVIEAEIAKDPALGSANTRRTYTGALADFEAWRDGRPVNKTLVEAYAAALRDRGLAVSTVNHRLAAVRWWARRLGDLAADAPGLRAAKRREIVAQAERAASVGNVKGDPEPRGRHVSDGEIRDLLGACVADDSAAGVRDAAMVSFAFSTGARRSEIAGLALGDVAQAEDNGGGFEVTIRGKGNKRRAVTVHGGAAQYLGDWLALRGDEPGPLWRPILKSGEIQEGGLSAQALYKMLAKRAGEAGIPDLGWHDARRTLAGNLLDAGIDLALVQRVLGHASPTTTSGYDRRPDDARRKAQRKVNLPYLRR